MYFFAKAMRCFFIRSVKSGFLAALRLGKPKPFCRRCCMVRTATFFSSSGCKFFSSRAVSRGFFCTSLFIKVSVAFDVFFFRPPPNLCLGTLLGGSPLAEARRFITVDFGSSTTSTYLFCGNFLLSPGKNSSLFLTASILSRHFKNFNIKYSLNKSTS